MLANLKRTIVMVKDGRNATMRVADENSCWSEDAHEWRYNFTCSPKENVRALELLVYGHDRVSYTIDKKLLDYLSDREAICQTEEYAELLGTIKAIKDSNLNCKTTLLAIINEEIHQRHPYDFAK